MPYLDCPHCHATFHTGLLYDAPESCPRCGASLHPPQSNRRQQLRGVLSRRRGAIGEPPDWEAITGSQYDARRTVSQPVADAQKSRPPRT